MINARTLVAGCLALVLTATARADQWYVINPPESARAEILAAFKADPASLLEALRAVLNQQPLAADAWIPFVREREHRLLVDELIRLGYGDKFKRAPLQGKLEQLVQELTARRKLDPGRQADALLRQLGATGRPEHISPLLDLAESNERTGWGSTPWGRWKYLAAVTDILARQPTADLLKAGLDASSVAPLLRDLEPDKAAELARALLDLDPKFTQGYDLKTRLWLAWSLSNQDPQQALPIFQRGLESRDAGLRLWAGLGIARLSADLIPFRLTAPPTETAEARGTWLEGLRLRKADPWRFAEPLAAPLVKLQRGTRVDLIWLNDSAKVGRRETNVWPGVLQILPDGTYLSRHRQGSDSSMVLTAPDGQVLTRFRELSGGNNSDAAPADHGGLWSLNRHLTHALEYGPDGDLLWSVPVASVMINTSARFAGPAGPGRALIIRQGVEIIDRRGDVVWSIREGLEDPRWACLVDANTVLVSCGKDVQLIHRARGLLKRVPDLVSPGEVRYHPDKPWLIFDAGTDAVLFDPRTDNRASVRIHWTNNDPTLHSRWLKYGQSIVED